MFLIINACVCFFFCLTCQAENMVVEEHENTVFIFKNKYIVYEFCKKRLLIATDQGSSWSYIKLNYDFDNIFFIDEKQGWGVVEGEPMKLFVTKDGGESWSEDYVFLSGDVISDERARILFGYGSSYRKIAKKLKLKIVTFVNIVSIKSIEWVIDGYTLWKSLNNQIDWELVHTFDRNYTVSIEEAIEIFGEEYQTIIERLNLELLKRINLKIVVIDNRKSRGKGKGYSNEQKRSQCFIDEPPFIRLTIACDNFWFKWGWRSDNLYYYKYFTLSGDLEPNVLSLSIALRLLRFDSSDYLDVFFKWRNFVRSSYQIVDNSMVGVNYNTMLCYGFTGYVGGSLGIVNNLNDSQEASLDVFLGLRWMIPYTKSDVKFGFDVKLGFCAIPSEGLGAFPICLGMCFEI